MGKSKKILLPNPQPSFRDLKKRLMTGIRRFLIYFRKND